MLAFINYLSQAINNSQGFDSWTIDSGYTYNLFKDIDLYVGARINSGTNGAENGLLSGIHYQFTERLSFNSTLYIFKARKQKQRICGFR